METLKLPCLTCLVIKYILTENAGKKEPECTRTKWMMCSTPHGLCIIHHPASSNDVLSWCEGLAIHSIRHLLLCTKSATITALKVNLDSHFEATIVNGYELTHTIRYDCGCNRPQGRLIWSFDQATGFLTSHLFLSWSFDEVVCLMNLKSSNGLVLKRKDKDKRSPDLKDVRMTSLTLSPLTEKNVVCVSAPMPSATLFVCEKLLND